MAGYFGGLEGGRKIGSESKARVKWERVANMGRELANLGSAVRLKDSNGVFRRLKD